MSVKLQPWVEKYRPKSFDDIVSQNVAINNLKEFVKRGDMPHMIFTGPAGTGKTSAALIIAKKLLKKENYYSSILELNASDTVRMEYVRNVLKEFVNQNAILGEHSLKIVILDEADNIPGQVQQALRRIMELSSNNVKFILMCNYINRIIDPIISRCAIFRFVNLTKEKIIERLNYIAQQEKLPIPEDKAKVFFETLYFISGGDLRKAINTLQMSVALELLDKFRVKDFGGARKILSSIESLDSRNFIRQLLEILPRITKTNSKKLCALYAFLGEIDYRISQGADEQIQITALIGEIIDKLNK